MAKGVLEGARRKLAGSVQPKEPSSYDVVADITRSLSTESPSIADIRFLFILLVKRRMIEVLSLFFEPTWLVDGVSRFLLCFLSILSILFPLKQGPCFRGNRANIQGVSTDKAARKSAHKFLRNLVIFVFNAYYINVYEKFDFFLTAKKRKSLSICQLSKKFTVWDGPMQYAFLDYSKPIAFCDVIKILLPPFVPIPCAPKKLYGATLRF